MMNKNEILRKIGEILAELNDQNDYLSRNPENLNDLELELFAANAEFLSNHISILVKLNGKATDVKDDRRIPTFNKELDSAQTLDSDSMNLENQVEENVEISDWKSQLEMKDEITFDFEKKEANELFDRPLTEEEIRVINEKSKLMEELSGSDLNSLQQVISEEPLSLEDDIVEDAPEYRDHMPESVSIPPVVKSEPEPLPAPVLAEPAAADTPPLSLNEILAAQTTKATVSSQLNQRQTRDLKGMISLNDKLLFVRDLFNGYSLAYSEAIELLNRFDTFESADNFLKQNYVVKNSWSEKQDVADKFYELLNRRFSS